MMSVLLVFASLVIAATAVPENIPQDIGNSLTVEANAVQHPVLETVSYVVSEKCDTLKKLLGLDYKQLEKWNQEPDLDKLTLVYVTKDGNLTMDFDTAVKLLPKTPDFKTKSLVIFVHGFTDNPNKESGETVTQAFLHNKGSSYNILALDSSPLIGYFYLRSTTYVRFIGTKLGKFFVDLVKEGLQPSLIHLVGHSLGSHISGFAGKRFLAATGQRMGRITGLDPAGPCFAQLDSAHKLGPNDADFVDVIHTNGGVAGLKEPVGQVDYYPNEGEEQPGCLLATCSHIRSWEYCAESLYNETTFPALKCDSWEKFKKGECSETISYMGIASKPGTTGKFYLQTGSTAPYGLGMKGTKYVNNEGLIKNLLVSVLLIFASLVVAAAAVPANFFQDLGEGFTKEAIAVKQPVLETVVDISSGQCDNVKKLFGVDYSQMRRMDLEPDLNQLSLIYVTKDRNVTLNINTVSKLLPKSSDFNREYFVIYVHGFTDNPTKKSFGAISNGFLSRGVYNILALDGSLLIHWFYLRSTTYVRFIGQKLGSILADLVKEGLPPSSIHLVGHSLGAQISGFTGKQFLAATGRRVGRISGLDPAGPCFSQLEPALKLSPDDADFVDVIHSNGGVAGLKEPVGHVDYYPNGGEQQPGCLLDSCSHSRSWEYYSESLHNDYAFPAVRCGSWDEFKKGNCSGASYMGIASEPGTTGKFYLQTGSTAPFSLGKNGTQYVNNEGFIKNLLG